VRRGPVLIVALALLLGAAATVGIDHTLAAWRADERSGAEFAAGVFQSQSQTTAATEWQTHPDGAAAELAVTDLTGLAPGGTHDAPTAGESHYVWLNIRTAPGSHWGGRLHLIGNSGTGDLAPALEYRFAPRAASTADCTAADLAAAPADWQPITDSLAADTGLTVSPDAADAVGLCFEVRVAASASGPAGSAYQGASADLRWDFTLVQD